MENRSEIITHLLDTDLVETCVDYQIRKQPQHYQNRDDIISDTWLWLLTYDEAKLSDAFENKHVNALITRYLQNQLFSSTSEYYRKYIKLNSLSDDIDDAEGIQSRI